MGVLLGLYVAVAAEQGVDIGMLALRKGPVISSAGEHCRCWERGVVVGVEGAESWN